MEYDIVAVGLLGKKIGLFCLVTVSRRFVVRFLSGVIFFYRCSNVRLANSETLCDLCERFFPFHLMISKLVIHFSDIQPVSGMRLPSSAPAFFRLDQLSSDFLDCRVCVTG